MDFIFLFLFPVPYLAILVLTLVWCLRSFTGKPPRRGRAAWVFLLLFELLFTVAGPAIGFQRFDAFGPDMPFSKLHVSAVEVITIAGSASFWIAKLAGQKLGSAVRWIVSGGMACGVLLCLFTTIHFGRYNLMGLMYPLFGFELLSPFMGIFILSKELWLLHHPPAAAREGAVPDVLDGPFPETAGERAAGFTGPFMTSFLLALPVLCACVLVNTAMGHPLDALVRAFTESSGFVFSVRYF